MHSVERGFPFILAPMHVIRDRKYQSSFINEEFGTCYWFACLQWFFVKFVMNTSAVLSSTRQYWRTPMVKQSDILTHILATKNEHPSVRSCCEPCLHRVQCFKTAGRKVTGTGAKKGENGRVTGDATHAQISILSMGSGVTVRRRLCNAANKSLPSRPQLYYPYYNTLSLHVTSDNGYTGRARGWRIALHS